MQTVEGLKARYNKLRGEQAIILRRIAYTSSRINDLNTSLTHIAEARNIVQEVAKLTQEQIVVNISSIVCLALSTVFEEPYKFGMEFVTRRNKTECDMFFTRGENRLDNLEDTAGGGAIDVASFGLRCASLILEDPPKRNMIILDEPFKHLRGEGNQKRASTMVKRISKDIDFQMLIVGDVNFSIEADRRFHLTKVGEGTKIEVK